MCNVKVNLIAKVSNHSPGKAYAGQHPCKGKIFKNIKYAIFFTYLGPCCPGWVEYPFQELARSGKLEQYVCSVNAKISNLKSWVYGFLIHISFQILQLCDEFVPGDPPEYFFDRWSSICLVLSSYFFQESRQLSCSSQHLSVGFHIQMSCLMTNRDSDGGCIQFWFISRTFFTVGQVTSSIAILCNVEVARLKLWLLTTNRVFFLFAVKECLRGKAAFEQELNCYTQSIFTSELQEMQVVFLSPERYKAITTSAPGAL